MARHGSGERVRTEILAAAFSGAVRRHRLSVDDRGTDGVWVELTGHTYGTSLAPHELALLDRIRTVAARAPGTRAARGASGDRGRRGPGVAGPDDGGRSRVGPGGRPGAGPGPDRGAGPAPRAARRPRRPRRAVRGPVPRVAARRRARRSAVRQPRSPGGGSAGSWSRRSPPPSSPRRAASSWPPRHPRRRRRWRPGCCRSWSRRPVGRRSPARPAGAGLVDVDPGGVRGGGERPGVARYGAFLAGVLLLVGATFLGVVTGALLGTHPRSRAGPPARTRRRLGRLALRRGPDRAYRSACPRRSPGGAGQRFAGRVVERRQVGHGDDPDRHYVVVDDGTGRSRPSSSRGTSSPGHRRADGCGSP